MRIPPKALWYVSIGALFSLGLLAVVFITEAHTQGLLTVDVFSIGQGDGILVTTPYHQQILIDGGPDKTIEDKVAGVMPLFDREIDMVIISHPHADHIMGLLSIFKDYKVDRVVWSGVAYDSKLFDTLKKEISDEHISTQIVRAGDTLDFGPDVKMEIVSPVEDVVGKTFKDVHEGTVVGRLVYKNNKILFTGDVNEQIEDEILSTHRSLDADVLKVSHHGSKYSTTDHFLETVHPAYAVISVGKENRYSHPHQELLDRLAQKKIPIYRTDQQGDIHITTNGSQLTVTHN